MPTYTVGPYDVTALVVGPAVGVLTAAKGPTESINQALAQAGGTVADIHFSLGANPATLGSNLNPFATNDSNAHVALFQKSVDASGNTTLTQVGPTLTMQYQTSMTSPGVTLDPSLGDLVVFTAQSNDPISFGVTPPGAPAPAPGTPGGAQPTPAAPVSDALAAFLKKAGEDLDKHETEMFDTSLIVGAIFLLAIVGMIMVYSKPSLPASIAGGAVDEYQKRRAPAVGAA